MYSYMTDPPQPVYYRDIQQQKHFVIIPTRQTGLNKISLQFHDIIKDNTYEYNSESFNTATDRYAKCLCIDKEHKRLYIYGDRLFSIFDLQEYKFIHIENNIDNVPLLVSAMCYIPSPIDQLQLLGTHTLHIKYNYNHNQFKCHRNCKCNFRRCGCIIDYKMITGATLKYIEFNKTKMLMLLGGTAHRDIYYCADLQVKRNNWKSYKSELPLVNGMSDDETPINFIVVLQFIILVF
eukprot:487619_1